jgi:hypothetical protein
MNDDSKRVVHLFDGETICCGMDVIDTIESCKSNGGIAIINQGANTHYAAVRYVTEIELCDCPDCIACVPEVEQDVPDVLSAMAHSLIKLDVDFI